MKVLATVFIFNKVWSLDLAILRESDQLAGQSKKCGKNEEKTSSFALRLGLSSNLFSV
jgi:hypothetical protein